MSGRQAAGRLVDMLHLAYQATHDDEELLGVPYHEQSAILQHLRLRIIPAEQIAENFEQHLQRTSTFVAPAGNAYETELRRFRRLTRHQRHALFARFMAAEGYILRDGDWKAHDDGCGDIEAFAFDNQTGKYLVRAGIDTHLQAMMALYDYIRPHEVGRLWPLEGNDRKRDALVRMTGYVAGFIVRLPKWQTPFLHLWTKEPGVPDDLWNENLRRVQALRLFLVAQHYGEPAPLR